jgi:hypothetical protein
VISGIDLSWLSDLLAVVGLTLTAIGAGWTARSVILTEEEAVKIGVARFAAATHEENLNLPHVQSLLASSKGAKLGLMVVVAGTVLQIIVPAIRLFG